MIKVIILSANSCHFVTCSACNNSCFLLSLKDKTRVKWDNSRKSTQKMRTLEFAIFLRSLEQFIQTVKGQKKFW